MLREAKSSTISWCMAAWRRKRPAPSLDKLFQPYSICIRSGLFIGKHKRDSTNIFSFLQSSFISTAIWKQKIFFSIQRWTCGWIKSRKLSEHVLNSLSLQKNCWLWIQQWVHSRIKVGHILRYARTFQTSHDDSFTCFLSVSGSPPYAAPELFQGRKYDGKFSSFFYWNFLFIRFIHSFSQRTGSWRWVDEIFFHKLD